jgi:hypothetical protein
MKGLRDSRVYFAVLSDAASATCIGICVGWRSRKPTSRVDVDAEIPSSGKIIHSSRRLGFNEMHGAKQCASKRHQSAGIAGDTIIILRETSGGVAVLRRRACS